MNKLIFLHTNSLINEKSTYLLQHAHNPVNWYPWGEEALLKAKTENKLLLISIGYSACHWCHVMESESFENEAIAEIMNENFVCIKVDREERPNIDKIYMDAVQFITGNGGWPLNCFALPDGRPVYGGTYFNPEIWTDIILQLADKYRNTPKILERSATQLSENIKTSDLIFLDNEIENYNFSDIIKSVDDVKTLLDFEEGGHSGTRKFPMPVNLNFFLEYFYYSGDTEILEYANITLKKMSFGGIFDQIAGGFARYSVDPYWEVPHFEKMLYDNAQLISVYSKAYALTKNESYKNIVYKTIEFCQKEFLSHNSGYFSAIDADSEGEEGKYYIWNKSETDKILEQDSDIFYKYFNITPSGNWERNKNILMRKISDKKFANQNNIPEEELKSVIDKATKKLLFEREKRIRPVSDTKILTSWNALMILALADAYQVFGESKFLLQAERTAYYIISERINADNSIYRLTNGSFKINGFLDDYSYTAEAFIKLFELTGDKNYVLLSEKLTKYTIEHFYNSDNGMFFYASDNEKSLFIRKTDILDNVMPASNSVTAKNLINLSVILEDKEYRKIADKMILNMAKSALSNILYHANWASLILKSTQKQYEFVVCGEKSQKIIKKASKKFRPDILFASSKRVSNIPILRNRFVSDETLIYVCGDNSCELPVKTVTEAFKLIKK